MYGLFQGPGAFLSEAPPAEGVGQEAKEEKKADKQMEIAYSGKDDKKKKPF